MNNLKFIFYDDWHFCFYWINKQFHLDDQTTKKIYFENLESLHTTLNQMSFFVQDETYLVLDFKLEKAQYKNFEVFYKNLLKSKKQVFFFVLQDKDDHALLKQLEKLQCTFLDVPKFDKSQKNKYLRDFIIQNNLQNYLNNESIELINAVSFNDFGVFYHELNKLLLIDKKTLNPKKISQIFSTNYEFNIFLIIDNLFNQNIDYVLKQLNLNRSDDFINLFFSMLCNTTYKLMMYLICVKNNADYTKYFSGAWEIKKYQYWQKIYNNMIVVSNINAKLLLIDYLNKNENGFNLYYALQKLILNWKDEK